MTGLREQYGTRLQLPYAAIIDGYQRVIFFPGPVLALAVLAGLAGLLIPRRRTAGATLLCASAVILMIIPTAGHEYTQRYVLPAIPLICIAAALALRRPAGRTPAQPPRDRPEPAQRPGPASPRPGGGLR